MFSNSLTAIWCRSVSGQIYSADVMDRFWLGQSAFRAEWLSQTQSKEKDDIFATLKSVQFLLALIESLGEHVCCT